MELEQEHYIVRFLDNLELAKLVLAPARNSATVTADIGS